MRDYDAVAFRHWRVQLSKALVIGFRLDTLLTHWL
jgi:hypothetical protein